MLTKDKVVVMVVMDRKEYIDKATNLLSHPLYRTIDKKTQGQSYYPPQEVKKGNGTTGSHLQVPNGM